MRFLGTACMIGLILFFMAGPALSSPPNIIIISVDTLRADHLGCYGYPRNTSPNMDRLVSRGLHFMRTSTNVPLTGPAFCSLFTSRYPHQTGAMRNGIPMLEVNVSLQEIFKGKGYTTAAFLSNWPLKAHLCGLKPGFDIYDDEFFKKRWLIFNDERDAVGVTDNTIAWLESHPEQPFLLWAHYSEPHAPYVFHREFDFAEPGPRSEEQRRIDNYDSEIAYADHQIGRLMEKIDEMGLPADSLIIFVADHGESLGEHGYVGHGRKIYESSINIPFALIGAGIPSGSKERALVQIIDLAPTALAYAGFEPGDQMLGMNLLPYIQRQKAWPERTIYMETYSGAHRMDSRAPETGEDEEEDHEGKSVIPMMKELKDIIPEEVVGLQKPLWIGFRRGDVKVLYSLRFSRWERYDVAVDPEETNNTADIKDPVFAEMSDELMAWYNLWEDEGIAVGRTDVMTEEDKKKLEALGYIDR